MSIAWLIFEAYLVVSFLSAVLVISACTWSARLPEKAPTPMPTPHKRYGIPVTSSPKREAKGRAQDLELAVRFSPFGI